MSKEEQIKLLESLVLGLKNGTINLDNKKEDLKCRLIQNKELSKDEFLNRTWNLKDEVDIPVGDEIITFVVEHVKEDGSAYFVSKDILCKLPHDDINDYLDNLFSKFPIWIQEECKYICHGNEHGTYQRKLSMLSSANVGGKYKEKCTGVCDIQFDGLKTEASRCKDYNGETCYWWLDTPYPSSSSAFMFVAYGGTPNGISSATYYNGVACAFLV